MSVLSPKKERRVIEVNELEEPTTAVKQKWKSSGIGCTINRKNGVDRNPGLATLCTPTNLCGALSPFFYCLWKEGEG